MDISDFQKKVIIFLFSTILIGAVLLSKEKNTSTTTYLPKNKHNYKNITQHSTNSIKKPQQVLIDINKASFSDLIKLPGIGNAYAQNIINFRKQNGHIKYYSELLTISGIGPNRLEKIKPYITKMEEKPPSKETNKTSTQSNSNQEFNSFPLNINECTSDELQELPYIGPVIANNIIQKRKELGKFKSIEELLLITGIGKKRLQQLQTKIYIDEQNHNKNTTDTVILKKENTIPLIDTRVKVEQIDLNKKCPYCGKQLWYIGKKKRIYIRCPHCLKQLSEKNTNKLNE